MQVHQSQDQYRAEAIREILDCVQGAYALLDQRYDIKALRETTRQVRQALYTAEKLLKQIARLIHEVETLRSKSRL